MPHDLEVSPVLVIPAAELRERFSRSSGPGGQSVNTTDSRVELSFDLAASGAVPESLRQRMADRLSDRMVSGRITVAASEHRSQLHNRQAARERLADVLRWAAAPAGPTRRPSRPSRAQRRRRLAAKRHRGAIKQQRSTPRRDD